MVLSVLLSVLLSIAELDEELLTLSLPSLITESESESAEDSESDWMLIVMLTGLVSLSFPSLAG